MAILFAIVIIDIMNRHKINPEDIGFLENTNLSGNTNPSGNTNLSFSHRNWDDSEFLFTMDDITRYDGIIFYDNFIISGETEQEKRSFIWGYLSGAMFQFSQNLTITIKNETRVYNIKNFPLQDDCIDEDYCFVRYGERK